MISCRCRFREAAHWLDFAAAVHVTSPFFVERVRGVALTSDVEVQLYPIISAARLLVAELGIFHGKVVAAKMMHQLLVLANMNPILWCIRVQVQLVRWHDQDSKCRQGGLISHALRAPPHLLRLGRQLRWTRVNLR